MKTSTIQSHETAKLSFIADKAGAFRFRCLVPGHMEAGMHGVLTVSD
ncbi:MAG: multicopper oxidase domain-containing protein [Alphaproteobacteria bacterium]|nr:multicopper oxidase domain-containing protein [Alphaproteobacteria bacterium]